MIEQQRSKSMRFSAITILGITSLGITIPGVTSLGITVLIAPLAAAQPQTGGGYPASPSHGIIGSGNSPSPRYGEEPKSRESGHERRGSDTSVTSPANKNGCPANDPACPSDGPKHVPSR